MGSLASRCRLLIVDEIHLLAEARGVGIVVARTARLSSSQSQARLVGLSATLPNYEDVGSFLGCADDSVFFFGPEFRPVPLKQAFAMIFVHSRRETFKTAMALRDARTATARGAFKPAEDLGNLLKPFAPALAKCKHKELRKPPRRASGSTTRACAARTGASAAHVRPGAVRVLCCTATLAWGVNLPAHAVICKGTDVYDPSAAATFLAVRLRKNPLAYGCPYDQAREDPGMGRFRETLLRDACKRLGESACAFDRPVRAVAGTEVGRVGSHFYLRHESVREFNERLRQHATDADILVVVCSAYEFEQLKPRSGERRTACVAKNAARVCRALFEMALRAHWPSLAERLLALAKAVERRLWWFQHPCGSSRISSEPQRAAPQVPEDALRQLEAKRLTVDRILGDLNGDPREVRSLVRNNAGASLVAARKVPSVTLEADVKPITRTVLRVTLTVTPTYHWEPRTHGLGPEPCSPRQPNTDLLPLRPLPLAALGDERYASFYSFTHFNPVQTQLFHSLYRARQRARRRAGGSGKTCLAELAIFKLLNDRGDQKLKAVYVAPLKALARERLKDWRKKFGELGLSVLELTGATPAARALRDADVLITTPEKWDGVTRQWRRRDYARHAALLCALLVIGEIHLLGEDRGPVIEAIVSRARFISEQADSNADSPPKVRIVGLSAALAAAPRSRRVARMMGRAGRPQFDDVGVACIFVHAPKKEFYKKFLYEPFPVESKLKDALHNHVMAEVCLTRAITSKLSCVAWLKWTYLFRRLTQNPSYYHLSDDPARTTSAYLEALAEATLDDLDHAGAVELDGSDVHPATLGQVASYYYLDYKAAQRRTVGGVDEKLGGADDEALAVAFLCDAEEFGELPVRHNEDGLNADLGGSVVLAALGVVAAGALKLTLALCTLSQALNTSCAAHRDELCQLPGVDDDGETVAALKWNDSRKKGRRPAGHALRRRAARGRAALAAELKFGGAPSRSARSGECRVALRVPPPRKRAKNDRRLAFGFWLILADGDELVALKRVTCHGGNVDATLAVQGPDEVLDDWALTLYAVADAARGFDAELALPGVRVVAGAEEAKEAS
ncbi:hypothetical protein JL720_13453 [Aureococcus anophagefferens]|nr:hypothetical protein JL720_13453 [Aureococcus anophagefferens]